VFKVFNEILIRSFCCCSISKDQAPASSEAARLFYHTSSPFVKGFL